MNTGYQPRARVTGFDRMLEVSLVLLLAGSVTLCDAQPIGQAGSVQGASRPVIQPSAPPLSGMPPTLQAPKLDVDTSPRFTKFPDGSVPLRGRKPGAQFLFETNGGIAPLNYSLHVQPTTYQSLFQVQKVRSAPQQDSARRTGQGADTPGTLLGVTVMSVKFDGLPEGQAFPSNIELFLRVTDAQGRLAEKHFNVRLTISAGVPVITAVNGKGGAPASPEYELRHANFALDEAGSRIECRYPSGLIYQCLPIKANGVAVHDRSRTVIRVPDIAEGNEVGIRLVNDSGASTYRSVRIDNPVRNARMFVSAQPSTLSLFTQVTVHGPDVDDVSKENCSDKVYGYWKSVSAPEQIYVEPNPTGTEPVIINFKNKPKPGSKITSANQIVYEWSGVGVEKLTWVSPYSYQAYAGKCPDRIIGQ